MAAMSKLYTRYYPEFRGGRRVNRFQAWADRFFGCEVPWWKRLLTWLTD